MSEKIKLCPREGCRTTITAATIDDLGRCVHCGLDYSNGGLERSEVERLGVEVASLRAQLAARRTPPDLREAEAELENLASDLEECSRLACVDKAEQRTYKSFAATTRRILAALQPQEQKTDE